MRWRIATSVALLGIAGVPAASDAARSSARAHAATGLHVVVKPHTGSPSTHFAISFRAGASTGLVGTLDRSYRVAIGATRRSGCESSTSTTAPAAGQGAMVRVTLSPGKRTSWCTGTYQGQVWFDQAERCGPPLTQIACPQIVIRPQKVGTFTFRVTRS
jgi:hypothetical protein